jgi:hypothetical protein
MSKAVYREDEDTTGLGPGVVIRYTIYSLAMLVLVIASLYWYFESRAAEQRAQAAFTQELKAVLTKRDAINTAKMETDKLARRIQSLNIPEKDKISSASRTRREIPYRWSTNSPLPSLVLPSSSPSWLSAYG